MKSHFPNRVDAFPLNLTVEERNALETGTEFTLVDAMYLIRELQKYVLTIAGVVSPVTTETTDTSVVVDISAVNAQIASLSAQVTALPAYLSGAGAPVQTLGKNGDTYWDTVGLYEYRKVGGSWRQQA